MADQVDIYIAWSGKTTVNGTDMTVLYPPNQMPAAARPFEFAANMENALVTVRCLNRFPPVGGFYFFGSMAHGRSVSASFFLRLIAISLQSSTMATGTIYYEPLAASDP